MRGAEPPIPRGIQAEPVGEPRHQEGHGRSGLAGSLPLPELPELASAQWPGAASSCPGWTAEDRHHLCCGTRVPGARAAASGSRRVDRPLTRLNERIDTGKTGQQKLLCQHRALSDRQNGPKSPLRGPPGQGTSCGRLDLRLWGPTSFLLTNFWLFTSRTIHSLPQSPWW